MSFNKIPFLFLSIILVIFSCDKKEQKPDFPLIFTGEVTEISKDGAVFSATFKNLDTELITDFGFVWSTQEDITIDNPYKHSFTLPVNQEYYSYRNTNSLQANAVYYVRTFVEYDNVVYYGKTVSFNSLGSKAPKILNIIPSKACFGDTVKINIGEVLLDTAIYKVFFNQDETKIISKSDSSLLIIIPYISNSNSYFTTGEMDVMISRYTIPSEKFKGLSIKPPQINTFYPANILSFNLLTIEGKGFHPNATSVFFGNEQCSLESIVNDKIICRVPDLLENAEDSIAIKLAGFVVKPGKIKILAPQIEKHFPDSIFSYEKLSLTGKNLDNDQLRININNQNATIQYRSPDSLVVIVMGNLCGSGFPVDMQISNKIKNYKSNLPFKQPANFVITPEYNAYYDGTFTIEADYLPATDPVLKLNNQYYDYNLFYSQIKAKSYFLFRIPGNIITDNGWINISADFCNSTKIKIDSVFHIPAPQIEEPASVLFNYTYYWLPGNFFHYDDYVNEIYIDGEMSQLTTAINYPPRLLLRVPDNLTEGIHSLQVKVNGQTSNLVSFTHKHRWEKISNTPEKYALYPICFNIGNMVYIGGGMLTDTPFNFYSFNLTTFEWKTRANLPCPPCPVGAMATDGLNGYVFNQEWKLLYKYDPVFDEWTLLSTLPFESQYTGNWSPNAIIYSNRFYTFSNCTNAENYYYDFEKDEWNLTGTTYSEDCYTKSIAYLNNKVYIFNGNRYHVYDLINKQYTKTGGLPYPMEGGAQSHTGFEYMGKLYLYEGDKWRIFTPDDMTYSQIPGPFGDYIKGNTIFRIGDNAYLITKDAVWKFDLTLQ